LLSQLGSITVPEETMKKLHQGEAIAHEEQAMVARVPELSVKLLSSIPRLESVRELISKCQGPPQRLTGFDAGRDAFITSAAILRASLDFDELETRLKGRQAALDVMRGREGAYDAAVIKALGQLKGGGEQVNSLRELPLRLLSPGMVLAEDLRSTNGLLLAARGFQVTTSFLEKARNFRSGYVLEPIRVHVPAEAPTDEGGGRLRQAG
jgi:hypothetical protein